jgi:hypothetical protein
MLSTIESIANLLAGQEAARHLLMEARQHMDTSVGGGTIGHASLAL